MLLNTYNNRLILNFRTHIDNQYVELTDFIVFDNILCCQVYSDISLEKQTLNLALLEFAKENHFTIKTFKFVSLGDNFYKSIILIQ